MNINTNLLEEYVDFVDNTKKQNKCFKILILIATNMFLFLSFLLFSYHTKQYPYNYKNTSIRIHVIIQY